MKKFILLVVFAFMGTIASAQTSKDIVGKWRLVSGKDTAGKEIDVKAMHKSDNVFNVFKDGGTYMHVSGSKVDTGTWTLDAAKKEITVSVNGKTNMWKVDAFSKDAVTVTGSPGTMNFIRI